MDLEEIAEALAAKIVSVPPGRDVVEIKTWDGDHPTKWWIHETDGQVFVERVPYDYDYEGMVIGTGDRFVLAGADSHKDITVENHTKHETVVRGADGTVVFSVRNLVRLP